MTEDVIRFSSPDSNIFNVPMKQPCDAIDYDDFSF